MVFNSKITSKKISSEFSHHYQIINLDHDINVSITSNEVLCKVIKNVIAEVNQK